MQNLQDILKKINPESDENFKKCLEEVLKIEGNYSNDINDEGGETYKGISRKFNPSWSGWQIIDKTKIKFKPNSIEFNDDLAGEKIQLLVSKFYKENYWDKLKCQQIENIKIAYKIFELAINVGIGRASIIIQNALNSISYPEEYQLAIDNKIGEMTIKLINHKSNDEKDDLFLKVITIMQGYLYINLAKNNKENKKFIHGWINRLNLQINIGDKLC